MNKKKSIDKKLCFISKSIPNGLKYSVRNDVCQNLPTHLYEGQHYCILHLPDDEKHKSNEFEDVFIDRLESGQNNFEYVYFSDAIYISDHTFFKEANFSYAIFSSYTQFTATFERATYFIGTEFRSDTFFEKSHFLENVSFSNAVFNDRISFSHTFFKMNVGFYSTNFGEESHLSFIDSDIRKTLSLRDAKIKGYVTFQASPYVPDNLVFNDENVVLDLQNVRLEKPERLSFHSVRLQPNWFINVDCKKFIFTNCFWQDSTGTYLNINSEFKALKAREIPNFYTLLTKACRQLADNFEEAKSFRTASRFREMAMETKRLGKFKGFRIWTLHWWYWILSSYGEDWKRAAYILLIILLGFTLIYTQTEFQTCPNNRPLAMSILECEKEPENCKCQNGGLAVKEAATHSVATALFQNIEHRKPLTVWGEILTYIEKILVPIQTALLALAIRRKFMR